MKLNGQTSLKNDIADLKNGKTDVSTLYVFIGFGNQTKCERLLTEPVN